MASVEKTEAAEGSVEATLRKMRDAMVNYDNMLHLARKLNDPRALRVVSDCKSNWSKRHRKIDAAVKQQLDEDMAKRIVERDVLRNRLRIEESEKVAEKRARKATAAAKAVCSEKRKAAKEAETKLKTQIDITWSEKSFGQGLQDAKKMWNYKKDAKVVISNYRDAFNRLRLRCPPLPDHLAVQWDDLQEEFGAAWLARHRCAYGNRAGKAFLESVGTLFKDTQFHRACAPCSSLHGGPALHAANCVCEGFPWRCQAWWITAGVAPG